MFFRRYASDELTTQVFLFVPEHGLSKPFSMSANPSPSTSANLKPKSFAVSSSIQLLPLFIHAFLSSSLQVPVSSPFRISTMPSPFTSDSLTPLSFPRSSTKQVGGSKKSFSTHPLPLFIHACLFTSTQGLSGPLIISARPSPFRSAILIPKSTLESSTKHTGGSHESSKLKLVPLLTQAVLCTLTHSAAPLLPLNISTRPSALKSTNLTPRSSPRSDTKHAGDSKIVSCVYPPSADLYSNLIGGRTVRLSFPYSVMFDIRLTLELSKVTYSKTYLLVRLLSAITNISFILFVSFILFPSSKTVRRSVLFEFSRINSTFLFRSLLYSILSG